MRDEDYYDQLDVNAAKRRARYHSDPEFRERVLRHSRNWYKRRAAAGNHKHVAPDEATKERRAAAARERKEQAEIQRRYEEHREFRAMKNKWGAKNQRDYTRRLKDLGVQQMSAYYERERLRTGRLPTDGRSSRRLRSS